MNHRKTTGLIFVALALLAFAAATRLRTTFGDSTAREGRALDDLVADGDRAFVGYDAAADKLTVVRYDGVNLGLVPTRAVTADTLARLKADGKPHLIVVRHSLPPP